MHDIEPWYGWRDYYIAEEDKKSPFYQRQYDEFVFTNKISVSYTHLRAHETVLDLVCRLLLEKKNTKKTNTKISIY